MKAIRGSKRTRALFWLYLVVGAIGMAVVIGMLVSLGGYFIFGWETAPVPQIAPLIVYAAISSIVLRLALAWSIRRDSA